MFYISYTFWSQFKILIIFKKQFQYLKHFITVQIKPNNFLSILFPISKSYSTLS